MIQWAEPANKSKLVSISEKSEQRSIRSNHGNLLCHRFHPDDNSLKTSVVAATDEQLQNVA